MAAAVALCLALVRPVAAQAPENQLPAASGKDVVLRVCTACHGADQFAYARLTPDEWENEVEKMQAAGAEMTSEEAAVIAAYLGKNLAKPAASATPPTP